VTLPARAIALALLGPGLATACARALVPAPPLTAPEAPVDTQPLLARADSLYASRDLAQVRESAGLWLEAVHGNPHDVEAIVGLARASIWLVDHEPSSAQREAAAHQAVQAAQWCEQAAVGRPACSYWMGAALGVQARERRTTALDALPRILQAFQRAQAGDPAMEEAGPDRALALFYLRAPGWPRGPGDDDQGLAHARAAVDRVPDYPPNQMALGEALAKTQDAAGSRAAYEKALALAQQRAASGDPDAREWIDEIEGKLSGRRRVPDTQ